MSKIKTDIVLQRRIAFNEMVRVKPRSIECRVSLCYINNKVFRLIKITTSDYAPLILTPEITRPLVYLDTCVISDLARDQTLGPQFRDCLLAKCGTLYISWAHLVELFGIASGPTYELISSYLSSFGPNFVLINSDALAILRKEAVFSPGKQNPVIDEELLICLAANWNALSEINVRILLDVVASDPSIVERFKIRHQEHKLELKNAFDTARHQYQTDRAIQQQKRNEKYTYQPGTPPTQYIYQQIVRECIITHEQFAPSDGLDFEHCVVPLAYCDYVVLDKKWARRCRSIDIPSSGAAVFSGTQIDRVVSEIKAVA
jgi:hypothetical protein